MVDVPLRTTAIEAAKARGMTMGEFSRRTGLSMSHIYNLRRGETPGAKAIAAIMRVFPDLPFERLFLPAESSKVDKSSIKQEEAAA